MTHTPLPLFAYNREVLKQTDSAMGKRFSSAFGNLRMATGSMVKYTLTNSEFDLNFLYLTEDIRSQEAFEVAYNSLDGISGSREITLNIPDIGAFKYFLTPNELGSKEVIYEDVYYKGIIGSITIRGFYFIFHSTGQQIKEINSSIIKSNDLLLKSKDEILATMQSLGV